MAEGDKRLLIGDVARQAGLNPKTIRFYEEVGLIRPCGRTPSGYRLFDQEALSRLTFIRKAQSLGFSLSEIREILSLRDGGLTPCEHVEKRVKEKISSIEERIRELERLKASLQSLLDEWKEKEAEEASVCPRIEGS